MAVVEDGSCEGCGETYDLEDLHVITINGEELACCEECRRHAERAAQQSQPECEGCGDRVPASELEAVELPDGVEIQCCQDCRKEASVDLTGDSTSVDGNGSRTRKETSGSAGADSSTSHSARSRSESSGTARSNGGRTRSSRTESEATTEISTETESTIANTENVCDNCQESFTIELYRVETIDGRTEEFCPDCKREGVEQGIVRDVHLRRAQAFEVLELTSSADEDSVREAYLRRVKEVHPDREDGNRSEFMLVKRAYERLSSEN